MSEFHDTKHAAPAGFSITSRRCIYGEHFVIRHQDHERVWYAMSYADALAWCEQQKGTNAS